LPNTKLDYGIEKKISSTDETNDPEFRSRFKVEPPPSAVLGFNVGTPGAAALPGMSRGLPPAGTPAPVVPRSFLKAIP